MADITRDSLDTFTRAYIEAALWSSTDNSRPDGGDPLDKNYDIEDIAQETLAVIVRDCEDFQRKNPIIFTADGYPFSVAYAGHDFWLTRNGHGAGFWDRGIGAVGEQLTQAAKAYGEFDLYIGDDGLIYGQ